MNAKQNNAHQMGTSVSKLLETVTATDELPALKASHVGLKTLLTDITTFSAAQAQPVAGRTADRAKVFGIAIDAAIMVAGPVASYAQRQALGELTQKVKVNRSDFDAGRLTARVRLLQQVHDAALEILPQLADYGITAATLADLQAKIDAANALVPVRRATIMSRRLATEKLDTTIRRMKTLLKRELDPLMEPVKATDPDSYALYHAAREIIDLPGTPQKEDKPGEETTPPPANAAPAPQKLSA